MFPKQVYWELRRGSGQIDRDDLPFSFADGCQERATALSPPLEALPAVLAIPGVAEVIDISNTVRGGVEPADPYIVAMAWHLNQQGHSATVITEDRKQDRKDNQISLATACGLSGIPDIPLLAFLASRNIWRKR